MPSIGDKVVIKPAAAHCRKGAQISGVLADGVSGRFLPVVGEEVAWTAHHAERFKHGEIVIAYTDEQLGAMRDERAQEAAAQAAAPSTPAPALAKE